MPQRPSGTRSVLHLCRYAPVLLRQGLRQDVQGAQRASLGAAGWRLQRRQVRAPVDSPIPAHISRGRSRCPSPPLPPLAGRGAEASTSEVGLTTPSSRRSGPGKEVYLCIGSHAILLRTQAKSLSELEDEFIEEELEELDELSVNKDDDLEGGWPRSSWPRRA